MNTEGYNTPSVEKRPTIRDEVNSTESMLKEAHSILNDILGPVPPDDRVSEKELRGSMDQAAYTIKTNKSLLSDLLARLAELRDKI